jgi:archaellum component FlaF (FlaF/FlaG flagellin family)
MTAGVAILAIIGIIYAAVLYTSAGPNQEQVKKAKDMLRNVVIGIIAFALMAALLQWLVPGGVF